MAGRLLRGLKRYVGRAFGRTQASAQIDPLAFRETFLAHLERAVNTGDVAGGLLGSGVSVLVFPPIPLSRQHAAEGRSQRVVHEALARLVERQGAVGTFTWAAVRDTARRDDLEPGFETWAGELAEVLESEIGIVFFFNRGEVAQLLLDAVCEAGFSAAVADDAKTVIVDRDGLILDFTVESLVWDAVLAMRGPVAVARARAADVDAEFQLIRELGDALRRRFPELPFPCDGRAWHVERRGVDETLTCRRLALQCRLARLEPGRLVAQAALEDLLDSPTTVHRKIKAPGFLAAYPDTVFTHCGTFVEVLARDGDDGTSYVLRHDDDPPGRVEYLKLLADLSRSRHHFSGHLFRAEVGSSTALCLAGYQAVSLAAEPSLLLGVLETVAWKPERVRVMAQYENGLIVADTDMVEEAMGVLQSSLQQLCDDLYPDGGDPLQLDFGVRLDAPAAGHYDILEVPGTYFEIRHRAALAERAGPPGRVDYYRGLGYEILGQAEQAAAYYTKALRYDRDDGELNLLLGRALNELNEFDRAARLLEKAVHALPEDADASNSLGVAYQCSGANEQALQAFERAAELSPEDPTILVNLGRAYFDADRVDGARATLERALQVSPSLYEAHASLAMLYFREGESADALVHARYALADRPDDEAMRELVALLVVDEAPD